MCRYYAFSVKTKHPVVLTRPIPNPQNPFSAPKFWSPGCTVTTGDDAISPKTWQHYGPLVNLLIEGCRFTARSGGIHFGASSWYDYVK